VVQEICHFHGRSSRPRPTRRAVTHPAPADQRQHPPWQDFRSHHRSSKPDGTVRQPSGKVWSRICLSRVKAVVAPTQSRPRWQRLRSVGPCKQTLSKMLDVELIAWSTSSSKPPDGREACAQTRKASISDRVADDRPPQQEGFADRYVRDVTRTSRCISCSMWNSTMWLPFAHIGLAGEAANRALIYLEPAQRVKGPWQRPNGPRGGYSRLHSHIGGHPGQVCEAEPSN